MEDDKKLGFDLVEISQAFGLMLKSNCTHLQEWVSASYVLDDFENKVLDDTWRDIAFKSEQMNEEELKIRLIAPIFYVAKVDLENKIGVFYERAIAATVKEYALAVISDCLVATPNFNLPVKPYFFLQEFKKNKGEKKDPEAQMLTAMIIAQSKNADGLPIYGGYLIGSNWRFTTLIGTDYCVSRKYDATRREDLNEIVYVLRKLKELIISRL